MPQYIYGDKIEIMFRNKKIFSAISIIAFSALLTVSARAESAETGWIPGSKSPLSGKLVISEIMGKNHASLRDEDGSRPDWIELHNTSPEEIDLSGFTIADYDDGGWTIPGGTVAPDGYFLIYADGKDSAGAIPHTDFKLSDGEPVILKDAAGKLIDSVECSCDTADFSQMLEEDGKWVVTDYPTPGFENTPDGYDAWQNTLECTSPLAISEVMTYNTSYLKQNYLDFCDWVELKNVSDADLELSEYYLSDDDDDLTAFQLPQMTLKPGKSVIVLCTDEEGQENKGYIKAPFALGSDGEQVYLSTADTVVDCVFLHDIPNGCSFGRESGKNGWFFFQIPQPDHEKSGGCRRVSRTPTTVCIDGIFNGVLAISVELSGYGEIYYTTDGSMPTVNSERYTQPFDVTKTCSVRAVSLERGAMVSRPLTLNYIINENHKLPVVCLSTDSPHQFNIMYNSKKKGIELPGNLSFYDGENSFSIPCGIDMHGETSLSMRKKNMGIHFRSAYGQKRLDYDLFGGGVTSFESLILRAGQDQASSIIKNELGENLSLQFSDKVFAQRSRYCALYINGEYTGLYTVMEKMNESHYATHRGVSKDSVTVVKSPVSNTSDFYREIVEFSLNNDLTVPENYEEFCRRMDIDSLIDWIIIEGYTGNTDLNPGNVRYAKSTEDDGKWRLMLFDLDSIMGAYTNCYKVVLGTNSAQYSSFIRQLIRNPEFKAKFLARAAEAFKSVLTDENVLAEIDRLAREIESEVPRDYRQNGLDPKKWDGSMGTLRGQITDWHWRESCIRAICEYFEVSPEEFFNGGAQ